MQKTECVRIRLPIPKLMPASWTSSAKNEAVATAVTISGTTSGRLMRV